MRLFVVAPPGLERVVAEEVRALAPDAGVCEIAGGVELEGPIALLRSLNLNLRSATRVLARVGVVSAKDFRKLRAETARLPWEQFIVPGQPVETSISVRKCRLYHSGAVAERVEAAVQERVGEGSASEGEPGPSQTVLVRGFRDRFEMSIDSSGELLHRRGWRLETASAPLRETLAAGMLALCEWDRRAPLVDPMCGSGTIAIEAATLAAGRAAGLDRPFAFEGWPDFDGSAWQQQRREASAPGEQSGGPLAPVILAADRDTGAAQVTRRNAERAGMTDRLRIEVAQFEDLEPPEGPGLVIINPPYGKRAGSGSDLLDLYGSIGRTLAARYAGWSAGVLVPDQALAARLGLAHAELHALTNGGLRIWLARGTIPGP